MWYHKKDINFILDTQSICRHPTKGNRTQGVSDKLYDKKIVDYFLFLDVQSNIINLMIIKLMVAPFSLFLHFLTFR